MCMRKYTKTKWNATLEQKLKSYTENNGCWEYNGCTNNYGYCLIMTNRKLKYAHRLAWEFHNGRSIPDDMTVDHICFNRKCINPAHLRLLSHKENSSRRSVSLIKTWCDKHDCPRKVIHYISKESGNKNTKTVCLKCASEYSSAYKKRKRTGGGIG